jgi:hypothetical protein
MNKVDKCEECCNKISRKWNCSGSSNQNPIYGLGVVGALFYFLQNANTIENVLIGIGKAVFWPAILIFKIFTTLQL